MTNPDGIREPDSKLWFRAQALRRVATDLVNSLKDTTEEEVRVRTLVLQAIEDVNDAAELLLPTPKPMIKRVRVNHG